MSTQTLLVTVEKITCARQGCGIVFGAPQHWIDKRREDHTTFYCPNGHTQWFPHRTEAEKLKAQLRQVEVEKGRLSETLDRVAKERDHHWTERKKITTRHKHLRDRIKNGVCPCCKRHFANVQKHIASKHPRYDEA